MDKRYRSLTIKKNVYDLIRKRAKRNRRTLAGEIAMLVEQAEGLTL